MNTRRQTAIIAKELSDIRPDVIKSLKKRISDGNYSIKSDAIAKSLILSNKP